jgi:phosphomannomutase/phosphoglucomutase
MSAIQVCHLLNNENKKMSDIIDALPMTYQTPTMAPFCKDEEKYQVVDLITEQFKEFKENKTKINDQLIKEIITINGVRFVLEDNSWGLIRASSNKPSLVVVVETLKSNKDTKNIFDFIDNTLQKTGKVGEYDQKI